MARTLIRKDPLQSLSKTRRRVGTVERKVSRKGVIPYLGSVSAGSLQADSVTVSALAAGSVTTSALAANSVTAYAISAGSVTAYGIAANTIIAGNIAAGTITATQIAASTITAAQIAAGSITADRIQAGSITATQIHAGAITATEIAAGTITATNIAAGTITATVMAAGSISTAALQAGSVTATKIAANTITAGNIAAGTITATEIAAGTITATNIAAGTITATNIAAGTITSSLLAANAVTSTAIASGAVTAVKISVSQLSAVAADMGTITAGTLTGATVQTATSGARLVMNTGGLTAYNASNVAQLNFDTATGNLTLSGTVTANSSSVVPTTVLTGTLTTGQIGTGNVTSTNILNGTVAGIDIAANTITASNIVASTITATELAAGSITAADMLANTITAGQIASGTITATQIQAGSITADRMNVSSLSAISANLGTMTAGSITGGTISGGTITGATFRTDVNTGARIELSTSGGLQQYSAASTVSMSLNPTTGLKFTTGVVTSATDLGGLLPTNSYVGWTASGGRETGRVSGFDFASSSVAGTIVYAAKPDATRTVWSMLMTPNNVLYVQELANSTLGGVTMGYNGAVSANNYSLSMGSGSNSQYVSGSGIHQFGSVSSPSSGGNIQCNGLTVGSTFTSTATDLAIGKRTIVSGQIRASDSNTWGAVGQVSGAQFILNADVSGVGRCIYLRAETQISGGDMMGVVYSSNVQNSSPISYAYVKCLGVNPSDIHTKSEIRPLAAEHRGSVLRSLRNLGTYVYRHNRAGEYAAETGSTRHDVGLMAHEVAGQFRHIADLEPDGTATGYTTSGLFGVLTESIKELADQRDELERDVSAFGDLLRAFAGDVGDAIGGAKGKKLAGRFAEWERLHSELAAA